MDISIDRYTILQKILKDSMKKIAYIVQQITDKCIAQRDNAKNRSYAGLQKSSGMKKMMEDIGYGVKIYSPSIVSNGTKKKFNSFYEDDIFHASVLDIKGLNFLTSIFSNMKELFKRRKEFEIVVYYNYSIETSIPAFFCKIFLGKKIYLEYEDGLDKKDGFASKIYKAMKYLSQKLSDGYILVNEGLLRELNIKPYMVANGVFDWELLKKAQRDELKSSEKNIIITYSGKISDYFGGSELLEYIKYLPKNCELHISGYYWKSSIDMKSYIKDNKLENVFWYGLLYDKEYQELLVKTDYFILLNEGESKYKDTNFPSKLFVYLSTLKSTLSTKKIEGYDLNNSSYKCMEQISDIQRVELKKNEKFGFNDIEFIYEKQKEELKKLLEN